MSPSVTGEDAEACRWWGEFSILILIILSSADICTWMTFTYSDLTSPRRLKRLQHLMKGHERLFNAAHGLELKWCYMHCLISEIVVKVPEWIMNRDPMGSGFLETPPWLSVLHESNAQCFQIRLLAKFSNYRALHRAMSQPICLSDRLCWRR